MALRLVGVAGLSSAGPSMKAANLPGGRWGRARRRLVGGRVRVSRTKIKGRIRVRLKQTCDVNLAMRLE